MMRRLLVAVHRKLCELELVHSAPDGAREGAFERAADALKQHLMQLRGRKAC